MLTAGKEPTGLFVNASRPTACPADHATDAGTRSPGLSGSADFP
ncbi:hypothetical protein SNL152K_1456 [Streptomyces sp. NL15-2K]|nr:hypothetical protein SNL152K_1456 [Streptomyces sp. NL15-2K]